MKVTVQRAYDKPTKAKSFRVLVDRLWPRGVTKAHAAIDLWAKDLSPSTELRQWFHTDPEHRYTEFKKRYRTALRDQKKAAKEIAAKHKSITLITAAKDVEHSHIPTLQQFLEKF